jgi:two-component system, cell cycle sensor histidine kinase and response regulator CckA
MVASTSFLLVLLICTTVVFDVRTFFSTPQATAEAARPAKAGRQHAATSDGNVSLTPQERQWLSRHDGNIRIGITVIPPQVLKVDGQYKGLSIDYIRLMERKLGCGFKLVPLPTWNDVILAARAQRVDMIFAAQETPERREYLLFTQPYIELPNMIVVRKDRQGGVDLKDMRGWRVATSEGSAVHEYLMREFPDLDLYPVADELTGLMKVSLGEADAMVVEMSRASYYIEKAGILNLRVSGSAGLLYLLRFAVRKDWPVLRGILTKGLDAVTDEEKRVINRRWIIVGRQSHFASRGFWIAFGTGLAAVLVTVAGVMIWNRTLRNLVRQRTSQLRQELAERRRAETRLGEQLHFFQQLLDSVPIPVFYKDREAFYLGCNAAFVATTFLARKDIVGKTVHQVVPKERADVHHEVDLVLLCHPGVQQYEVSGVYKDGKHHDIIFTKSTFFDAEGRVAGIVGTQMDITELKQAERERLANLRFFECMDRVNRAIQGAEGLETMMRELLDITLEIFECHRAFLLFPCAPEAPTWNIPMERSKPEYPGVRDLGRAMPMDRQVAETLRILLAADGPVTFGPGTPHALPEDVARQFSIKSFMSMAIYPKTGSPWQFGIHQCDSARIWTAEEKRLFQEIGRRLADGLGAMLAHRKLCDSLDKLEQAQRIAHIGSWELDLIHNVLTWSDEVFRIFEIDPEIFGASYQAFLDTVHPDDRDAVDSAFANALETRSPYAIDHRLLFPDGRVKFVHEQCETGYEGDQPIRSMGTVQDITERKILEMQLRQSQKMEAVGQLAGGVAHDFNNMLGVIIGYTELALGTMTLDDALRKNLEEILEAAQRSVKVTRQLLAFARKQTIEPKILDLNETVEKILKLLRRLIGEDINLVWQPGPDIWPVRMDPSQLDQILANLCVNARDAIDGVGEITVETHNAEFEDASHGQDGGVPPGAYVVLAVSDTGGGMDKPTMDRIFEPFFTTKEVGKGTGMGLATVYGIVEQNAGCIQVTSKPGHGSTFKVCLPRHTGLSIQESETEPESPDLRGHETILVVEDEVSHLRMVKLMIEKCGYRVLTASSPSEALHLAKKNSEGIHLMLTDLIMPEMNGRDLAREMAAICPDTACLYMSGHTGDTIAHHGIVDEGVHFIHKPFSKQALAAKIREVLDYGQSVKKLAGCGRPNF